MEENHLRSVPTEPTESVSESPAGEAGGTKEGKRPSRPRSDKALPTDRLKLDAQKAALQAIAVASDYGKHAVGSTDIGPRMGIASSTAALNNNFFLESGLIKRESKGKYLPTEEANSFARAYSFNKQEAGSHLQPVLKNSWYFKEVRQQLAGMGPATKETLIELLVHKAGASKEHESQLAALLSWLEYAQLIVLDGSIYKLAKDLPEVMPENSDGDGEPTPEDKVTGDAPAAAPSGTTKVDHETGRANEIQGQPVLSFSFDVSLTKEDLEALSADQIEAIFAAVGKVMAIKTE